jgi:hypothetical protein
MKTYRKRTLRLGALLGAAVGGAGLMIGMLPLLGQQGGASVQIGAMGPSPRIGRTRVPLSFDLPQGLQLRQNPRIRVTDAQGQLEELLPVFIVRSGSRGECYRDLHTQAYRRGTYTVRGELETVDARGGRTTVVSPATTLTIP